MKFVVAWRQERGRRHVIYFFWVSKCLLLSNLILLEQRTHNPLVVGSSPTGLTAFIVLVSTLGEMNTDLRNPIGCF